MDTLSTALTIPRLDEAQCVIVPEAIQIRDAMLARSIAAAPVTDDESQTIAVRIAQELKAAMKAVEANRQERKAPILALGRALDSMAQEFCAKMESEIRRLENQVAGYQAEQRRIREAEERRRQEEARRQREELARIEAERLKKEEEARQAKEAEQAAAANELFAMLGEPPTPEAEIPAVQPAAFAQQQPTAAQLAAEAEDLQARQAVAEAELLKTTVNVPAKSKKVGGLAVATVWRFEVLDLATLYASRPELCRLEENTAAINAVIRAGARAIPGLRIFDETKATVKT